MEKCYSLMSFILASFVICNISDGECKSFLCRSYFAVLFSTGILNNHLVKAVETEGIEASVNGSNFVETHL